MAEYKTIKGFKTQSYATDPVAATAAWSSGGALPTAHNNGAGFGTQTAAVSAGGNTPGGATNNVQTYNGTAWTEVNNMTRSPTEYSNRGAGTTTAGVTWGGTPVTGKTEKYDGTSWTASGVMNTGRYATMGTGTQTAAMAGSGVIDPPTTVNCETFNGSTWTEINNVNTARRSPAGGGTTTAAIIFGGGVPTAGTANSETWNGTSWAEGNNLNTARAYPMGTGDTVPTTMGFGGYAGGGGIANTELYDGTCWAASSDLATARSDGGGAGTGKTSALCFGGEPPRTTATEEWNDYSSTNPAPSLTMLNEGQIWYNTDSTALKYTASIGAWASSPSINDGRTYIVGAGTNTAGIIFGGGTGKTTETFDGTAWTEVNDLLANTSQSGGATSGTQTATLSFGMPSGVTETWNGTSWTTAPATMGTGRYIGQACGGTATAAIAMGGTPYTAKTETYNGTTWTEVNDMQAARGEKAGCGSTASAISAGGRPPAGTGIAELWDGTSWAVTGSLNTGRYYQSAAGDSGTAALMFAGIPPPAGLRVTESFDGTSWTELADLSANSAYLGGGVGNSSAAIAVSTGLPVGGSPTASEVWTYADTVKTVTVS